MELIINAHISREPVGKPEMLPLTYDRPRLVSGIFDSLSVFKLVPFQEDRSICAYLQTQYQVQGVQE